MLKTSHCSRQYAKFGMVLCAVWLLLSVSSTASSRPSPPGSVPVHLFVITMFHEETRPWLEGEKFPLEYDIRGTYAPVWCSRKGLCVTKSGMGKAHVAASLTAILLDQRFDWSDTIFLTAGIGGAKPDIMTLGGAALAHYSIDWDLGHRILHEKPSDPLFMPTSFKVGYEIYRLNQSLGKMAYQSMEGVELVDSEQAQDYRSHYPGQKDRKPRLEQCDTISGDDYWHGAKLSDLATSIVALRSDGKATYCTTQMEDTATAMVLERFGLLDRYVSLRAVSNFDQPYPGQTIEESLSAHSGGFSIASENAYRLGKAFFLYLQQRAEVAR